MYVNADVSHSYNTDVPIRLHYVFMDLNPFKLLKDKDNDNNNY